jgi:hypothetical protein
MKMFDLYKVTTIDDVIKTSSEATVKAIDYQESVVKEYFKFLNDITNNTFYTYTVSAENAVKKGTEYAKEAITKNKKLSKVS